MTAYDLMIGDYVYAKVQVDDTDTEPIFRTLIRKVTDLSDTSYGIYVKDTSEFAGAEVTPIPLTVELLEEIGYKYNSVCDVWETIPNNGYGITIEDDGGFSFCLALYDPYYIGDVCHCVITAIKYVHELQHLHKSCGLDCIVLRETV